MLKLPPRPQHLQGWLISLNLAPEISISSLGASFIPCPRLRWQGSWEVITEPGAESLEPREVWPFLHSPLPTLNSLTRSSVISLTLLQKALTLSGYSSPKSSLNLLLKPSPHVAHAVVI